MKKEQFIKVAIGGAIVIGLVYLISKSRKKTEIENKKINSTVDEEEVSNVGGVYSGGGGYYVKCKNGSTSMVYGTYDQASSMVDNHCRDRGGAGIVVPVNTKGARLSQTR